MTLDQVPTGQSVRVEGTFAGPSPVGRRLAELGIRRGSVLRMLVRTAGGGAIVGIGDDRIAVSRQILHGLQVAAEATHP